MSDSTIPVFIVGSGRSGTRSLFRMLAGTSDLEIHHEYAVLETQKMAALYYMDLIDHGTVERGIAERHGAAIHYSTARIWADSSNKLTWLIEPLAEMFPTARFLAVMRDGRKVVPSFYYKLREEMYDDASTAELRRWLETHEGPMPPAEKRYWWNIPQPGQAFHAEFPSFDRFQRVAYHWAESNRTILDSFSRLPAERTCMVRLEDLRNNEELLRTTLAFIGVSYDDTYLEYLQTPRNVFFPLDFQLTQRQRAQFDAICSPMMDRLGYAQREVYRVDY